ncbi:MAG: class I tRNA ligase family protein [Gammaproteobacteria bacterium]|nr:class I tRNA ligase family protein [Gammaproteobacteria bacterium]
MSPAESGTGIVHQAPAFGEDDFRVLKTAGIDALVCPVDMNGRFTEEVTDFAGQHVKDADKEIIRKLKDEGALYRQDVYVHSYPFCPRSDTPIIYRTIDSWYVEGRTDQGQAHPCQQPHQLGAQPHEGRREWGVGWKARWTGRSRATGIGAHHCRSGSTM